MGADERLVALFLNIFKSLESAVSEWEQFLNISDFQIEPQFGISSSRNVEIYYYHLCSVSLICQLSVVSFC